MKRPFFFTSYCKLCIVFLLVLLVGKVHAQSDEDLVTVADEMYKFGDIKDALEIYKQAAELNNNNAYANYMTGRCFLETIHKEKSLPYLNNAYELDHQISFNILFLIGTSYHLGYNFEKAIEFYEKYRTKLSNERENDTYKSKDEIKKIDRRIEECRNGMYFLKNPSTVKIENLGKNVNSPYEDYAPVISADQTVLFFTSRRLGSTGGNKANDNEYYEDIYFSEKKGDQWSQAVNIGKAVNSELHEASIGLSQDGKTLFIYKDNDKYTGDIFLCKRDLNGKWSRLSPLGKEINSEYIENSVTISRDGKTLFFASNRPGGMGGMDIYMSRLGKNGKWSTPQNLGEEINTTYDDEGPYIDADSKTLYFSSKGHQGMGGFDIYKSSYDSAGRKWSKPVNLGFPINSTDDDIYFVVSGDNKCGYYASVKDDGLEKEGLGDVDLFKINFTIHIPKDSVKIPKPISLNSFSEAVQKSYGKTVLNLNIVSAKDHKPLNAKVEIMNVADNTNYHTGFSEKGKLQVLFTNESSKEIMVVVSKEGYIYKKERMTIARVASEDTKVDLEVALDPVELKKKFILRNVYFDFNKATISPASYPELNNLYNFLKSNPKVKVEIHGHTDFIGSADYNLKLSTARAEAIAAYLHKKGISSSRIAVKGFGKSQPLASNDDEEEGRELNRRTEVVIVTK